MQTEHTSLATRGDGEEYTIADMRRPLAILGSLGFLVLAPGFVVGVVPWWITHWKFESMAPAFGLVRALGALLILFGAAILLDSFVRFALQGFGTPAPVLPTKHLIVTGLYRYVRNPMYVGVSSAILGQSLLFASRTVLIYGVLVWLAFALFVLFYEEPTLGRTFGQEYQAFCRNVPRWIPRIHPWRGDSAA